MESFTDMQMQMARERIGRYRREADNARDHGPRSQPIRQRVGRTIIRIGQRMAAEPSFRPARSR